MVTSKPANKSEFPKSVRNGIGHDYIWETNRGELRGYHRRTEKNLRIKSPTFRGENLREVQTKITDWLFAGGIAAALNAKLPKPKAFTVGDLLQPWFDSKKWSATGREANEYRWKKHVVSDTIFWNTPLLEFKVKEALRFLHGINGSENTKKKVYDIVSPGFNFATRRHAEMCPRNPFLDLEPEERPVKSASRIKALSVIDERLWLRTITANGFDPLWCALILFLFDAGAEPQEFLGVQWRDFNWERGSVHLRRTADQGKNGVVLIKEIMKSKKRNRRLPLGKRTLAAIRALWRDTMSPEAYVFSPDGAAWGYNRFLPSWRGFIKQSGLPYYVPLCLRHTMATRLLSQGAPLTAVSARLGHQSFVTTLTHYAHAVPEDADALAAFIEARFAAILEAQTLPESPQDANPFGLTLAQGFRTLSSAQ